MKIPFSSLVWGALLVGGLAIWGISRYVLYPKPAYKPRADIGKNNKLDCRKIRFRGVEYDVCFAKRGEHHLRLFLENPDTKEKFYNFGQLGNFLRGQQKELLFAVNAGMFDPSHEPQGLYVEAGVQRKALDLGDGGGNFYMKPNGVFYLTENEMGVATSERFAKNTPSAPIQLATQSGPMLVIDNEIHPAFKENSRHTNLRNGVGLVSNTEVAFAISNAPVTLYDFALLFRDALHCRQALYLDGAISKMFAPKLNRYELNGYLGPILGIYE